MGVTLDREAKLSPRQEFDFSEQEFDLIKAEINEVLELTLEKPAETYFGTKCECALTCYPTGEDGHISGET